ncbi:hypothetical protein XthCFBP4691_18595 [Xanthomonas theicola]|uniref:Uncharacterized protein n=2 Tax=Xanthomonas theicola TaxID=56464 RepID=A0A2S6ZAN3_9XANT|nr:hypothetical protein [Xanthomonas theicola]PPT79666.1 hypothetical protein XthCFBP4691_18595 [Xanthomonas theicola]QNH26062.1 hypothetical protein G4Q83_16715 [Xanthomonas theicola]
MNHSHAAEQQKTLFQPSLVGDLDSPSITLLGSLDDDRGTGGMKLEAENPKPFLAIIYTGI